jgi:hypothetical protein
LCVRRVELGERGVHIGVVERTHQVGACAMSDRGNQRKEGAQRRGMR